MTSAAKTITKTTKVVNNNTGVTTSRSITRTGNTTTITRTTTIGKPKTTSSSASTSTPAKTAAAMVLGEAWITGPNDTRDLCAPVALANCLLAATGIQASNGDIERLYKAAGGIGDSGVPLLPVLAAAASTGLAGCRLATYRPAAGLDDADLLLIALAGLDSLHAAAAGHGDVVMWGAAVPLDDLNAAVIGAWSLTWHGEDTPCRLSA